MAHPRKRRDQVVLHKGWAPSSGKVSPLMKAAYAAEKARLIGEGFPTATHADQRRLHYRCLETGRLVLKDALSAHQTAAHAKRRAEHKARCDAQWEAKEKARKEEKRARLAAKRADQKSTAKSTS